MAAAYPSVYLRGRLRPSVYLRGRLRLSVDLGGSFFAGAYPFLECRHDVIFVGDAVHDGRQDKCSDDIKGGMLFDEHG